MTTGTGSFDSQPHPQGRIGGSLAALRARVFSDAAALEREEPAAAATASPAEATAAPRDPIQQWNEIALRTFIAVGIFSVFVNLLMLTMPIYLFQISDRVLTSRSLDTLRHAVAAGLRLHRRPVAARYPAPPGARPAGDRMETILGGPVLASIVTTAPASDGGNMLPLRSLHQVRGFMSSPTMLILFDAPMAPLYFSAVFLIHPTSASSRSPPARCLFIIAFVNQRATSASARPGQRIRVEGRRAGRGAGAQRAGHQRHGNAQREHSAMGPRAGQRARPGRWPRSIGASGSAAPRAFFRLLTQIAILGWGAYLALEGQLTGGMMIAASIIAGRALQPLEGMIEGWRSVVQTRAAYGRVRGRGRDAAEREAASCACPDRRAA